VCERECARACVRVLAAAGSYAPRTPPQKRCTRRTLATSGSAAARLSVAASTFLPTAKTFTTSLFELQVEVTAEPMLMSSSPSRPETRESTPGLSIDL